MPRLGEGENTGYYNSGLLRIANNSFKTSLVQEKMHEEEYLEVFCNVVDYVILLLYTLLYSKHMYTYIKP